MLLPFSAGSVSHVSREFAAKQKHFSLVIASAFSCLLHKWPVLFPLYSLSSLTLAHSSSSSPTVSCECIVVPHCLRGTCSLPPPTGSLDPQRHSTQRHSPPPPSPPRARVVRYSFPLFLSLCALSNVFSLSSLHTAHCPLLTATVHRMPADSHVHAKFGL